MAVIAGSSRTHAPWWRKLGGRGGHSTTSTTINEPLGTDSAPGVGSGSNELQEVVMVDLEPTFMNFGKSGVSKEARVGKNGFDSGSTEQLVHSIQGLSVEKEAIVVGPLGCEKSKNNLGLVEVTTSHATLGILQSPLRECTNREYPPPQQNSLKTFKKLVRNIKQNSEVVPLQSLVAKRPVVDIEDQQEFKKSRKLEDNSFDKENVQVVTGYQSHPAQ